MSNDKPAAKPAPQTKVGEFKKLVSDLESHLKNLERETAALPADLWAKFKELKAHVEVKL